MNNYFLPIFINDTKVYILDLKKDNSSPNKSYIIKKQDNKFNLISINYNTNTYYSFILEYNAVFESFNNNILSIKFIKKEDKNIFKDKKNNDYSFENLNSNYNYSEFLSENDKIFNNNGFEILQTTSNYNDSESRFELILNPKLYTEDKLSIKFILEDIDNIKTEYLTDTLVFYFPIEKNIINAALDYGSEASQIVHNISDSLNPYCIPDNMSNFIKNFDIKNVFDINNFEESIQYSDDSKSFLKSIFLYQSENAEKEDNEFPSNKYFKFITKEDNMGTLFGDTVKKYKILPNLKLAYLNMTNYNVSFSDSSKFSSEEFIINTKKLIISNFIFALIKQYNNEEKFLNFILLYPNVYNQLTINKVKLEIESIFNYFLSKNLIKGFEITLVSESDAVFLGYAQKYKEKVNDNSCYLIIDSGKGTTDYSIISTGSIKHNEINTNDRDGIVGAGNLISFAILNSIIADIAKAKNKSISEIINLFFFKIEQNNYFKLISKIEKIKKSITDLKGNKINYNLATTDLEKKIIDKNGTDKGRISIFLDILDNIDIINDNHNYIAETINYLVNNIYNNNERYLENKNTKIILSGRAFKFIPFYNKLRTKFSNYEIEYLTDFPKDIALYGVFNGIINYSLNIEGIPLPTSNDKTNNSKSKLNINFIDKLIPRNVINVGKKVYQRVDNLISRNNNDIILSEKDFIKFGLEIKYLDFQKFNISNSIYNIPQELINKIENNSNSPNPILFFNGTGYSILHENKYYNLTYENSLMSEIEKELNLFSMFPFIDNIEFLKSLNSFKNFLDSQTKDRDNVELPFQFDL